MSISNRIYSLETRHQEIDEQIRQAYIGHSGEELISNLKKQKLNIKEEIETLKKRMSN